MRNVARIRLALAGLTLALPASAGAGQPETCLPCQEAAQAAGPRAPRLCASCAAKMQGQGAMPPMMAGGPACATCQADGAGYASTGGPAPGYASTGMMMTSGEPTPIGVVQAGYSQGQSPAAMPMAPGRASVGPMAPSIPMASMNEHPDLFAPRPRHRSAFFSTLLGLPRLGTHREARQEQARQDHAQMTFGQAAARPTEMPTSLLYGPGGGH